MAQVSMAKERLDIIFQDDERANGVIVGTGNVVVSWTAVRSAGREWYIVLHGGLQTADRSIFEKFGEIIQERLSLRKAA